MLVLIFHSFVAIVKLTPTNTHTGTTDQQRMPYPHNPDPTGTARFLFIDFGSAFNKIIAKRLVTKLYNLGLLRSICLWIKDFLSDCSELRQATSAFSLNTSSPRSCELSPLLYTLYANHCTPIHPSNSIIQGWHNGGSAHHRGKWDPIQVWSGTTVTMVHW